MIEAPARVGLPTLPHIAPGLMAGRPTSAAARAAGDHMRAAFARAAPDTARRISGLG